MSRRHLRDRNGPSSCGGEGEIRTPEPREGLPVFKTGAINRSATSPLRRPIIREDCWERNAKAGQLRQGVVAQAVPVGPTLANTDEYVLGEPVVLPDARLESGLGAQIVFFVRDWRAA